MAVPRVAGIEDLPGGHLQGGEQRGGAVPDVVVGPLVRDPRCNGRDRWKSASKIGSRTSLSEACTTRSAAVGSPESAACRPAWGSSAPGPEEA